MRFSYRRYRTLQPVPSLGGQSFRSRPVVSVTLLGLSNSYVENALLDSGADDTAFPERLAGVIGVDLTTAPVRTLTGIGPSGYQVWYVEIRLRLTDGVEFREWPAWITFTNAPMPISVLGFAGCLQFFNTCFYNDIEEVEMTVNTLYPGT